MKIRSVVLLIALSLHPLSGSAAGESELQDLINDYYYAIGENRLNEAMAFYHENSPEADGTRQNLLYGQSAYLQRTSTLSFDLVQRQDNQAVVQAVHRHLRIVGIKFLETFTETKYVLRRQDDTWKIWSSSEHRVSARVSPEGNPAGVPPSLVVD